MTAPPLAPNSGLWPSMLKAAERMRASREENDPASTLSQDERSSRARVAASLVAVMRGLVREEDIGPLPAPYAEIRADLAKAAPAAARLAAQSPDNAAIARYALGLAALAAQMQPCCTGGDKPSIVLCHEHNQIARARPKASGAEPDIKGGGYVESSAVRAPLATPGRGVSSPSPRPGQHQPGLL